MRTLYVSIVLIVALATTAFTADAPGVWNQTALAHGFDRYPVGSGETFAQHYHGSNIDADFGWMMNAVSQVMGTSIGSSYNDLMNATLENWGGGAHREPASPQLWPAFV